jgi:hypothetical protein
MTLRQWLGWEQNGLRSLKYTLLETTKLSVGATRHRVDLLCDQGEAASLRTDATAAPDKAVLDSRTKL